MLDNSERPRNNLVEYLKTLGRAGIVCFLPVAAFVLLREYWAMLAEHSVAIGLHSIVWPVSAVCTSAALVYSAIELFEGTVADEMFSGWKDKIVVTSVLSLTLILTAIMLVYAFTWTIHPNLVDTDSRTVFGLLGCLIIWVVSAVVAVMAVVVSVSAFKTEVRQHAILQEAEAACHE